MFVAALELEKDAPHSSGNKTPGNIQKDMFS